MSPLLNSRFDRLQPLHTRAVMLRAPFAGRVVSSAQAWRKGTVQGRPETHWKAPVARTRKRVGTYDIYRSAEVGSCFLLPVG